MSTAPAAGTAPRSRFAGRRRRPARAFLAAVAAAALGAGLAVAPIDTGTARAADGDPLSLDWAAAPEAMGQAYSSMGIKEQFSSPAVGDLDGNGTTQVVVGGVDGRIRIYDAGTGALVRKFNASTVPGIVASSPALADLDLDGKLDIVVGFMPSFALDSQVPPGTSTVAAFRSNGTRMWSRRTCTYPKKVCDVFASPVIADVDGNGVPDVVITSQDHYLHVLSGTSGAPVRGFPYFLSDTSWSTPAVSDLNGDGRPEIVVASDLDYPVCAGNPSLGCAPGTYGSVIRIVSSGGATWAKAFMRGEIAVSSPVIGHVSGPGDAPQIVIGSGVYFSVIDGSNLVASQRVWAFDVGLKVLPGWPRTLGGRTIASPALADVDGDGRATVFTTAEDGRVYAIRGDGTIRWSACARNGGPCSFPPGVGVGRGSPIVADVDGDGRLEVIAVAETSFDVFDAETGAPEQSMFIPGGRPFPFVYASTPTAVDLGGRATVFVHGLLDANANQRRDGPDRDLLVKLSSDAPLGAAPWPRFHHDMYNRGADDAHMSGGVPPPPVTYEQCVASDDATYVRRLYHDLIGAEPSAGQLLTGCRTLAARPGERGRTTYSGVVVRTADWVGQVVSNLYRQVLGRDGDPGGIGYWTGRILHGMLQRDVAIAFYGSPEQYARWGGTATDASAYVGRLYSALLGREPDADGLAYWSSRALREGSRRVAAVFYESAESRSRRVTLQYQGLLCRATDPGGLAYWSGRLRSTDDLVLTQLLVASGEYYTKAVAGASCPP